MPVDVIVAIISGLLGGGALTTLLKWLFDRIDRQSHQPTREEIEQLQQWAANDYTRLQKADREHDEIRSELRELRLERMREELFTHPHSKEQHEHLLDLGKEYVSLGGNGAGHAQLENLEDDFQRRLNSSDWDYRPKVKL